MTPPQLEQLGHGSFSFYPPIRGIEHNEWVYRRATWSEILVANAKSAEELWVPLRFLGEISSVEEPFIIVGLAKELEYKSGAVWPYERRVLSMPRSVNDVPRIPGLPPATTATAVEGIRYEASTEWRIGRLIGAVLVLGILACVLVVGMFRTTRSGTRVSYTGVLQSDFQFTAQDDYHAVVRKLGQPANDRWRAQPGEMQYRRLDYPQCACAIILMGTETDNARYVGAVDFRGRVIHSVRMPSGVESSALLKRLPGF